MTNGHFHWKKVTMLNMLLDVNQRRFLAWDQILNDGLICLRIALIVWSHILPDIAKLNDISGV